MRDDRRTVDDEDARERHRVNVGGPGARGVIRQSERGGKDRDRDAASAVITTAKPIVTRAADAEEDP